MRDWLDDLSEEVSAAVPSSSNPFLVNEAISRIRLRQLWKAKGSSILARYYATMLAHSVFLRTPWLREPGPIDPEARIAVRSFDPRIALGSELDALLKLRRRLG